MDNVLVPWENVFVYGDIERPITFFLEPDFFPASSFMVALDWP